MLQHSVGAVAPTRRFLGLSTNLVQVAKPRAWRIGPGIFAVEQGGRNDAVGNPQGDDVCDLTLAVIIEDHVIGISRASITVRWTESARLAVPCDSTRILAFDQSQASILATG